PLILTCRCLGLAPPPALVYSLSLHDALPISRPWLPQRRSLAELLFKGNRSFKTRTSFVTTRIVSRSTAATRSSSAGPSTTRAALDRKSTRLNSSHEWISYAVFCLKKQKITIH